MINFENTLGQYIESENYIDFNLAKNHLDDLQQRCSATGEVELQAEHFFTAVIEQLINRVFETAEDQLLTQAKLAISAKQALATLTRYKKEKSISLLKTSELLKLNFHSNNQANMVRMPHSLQ